MRDWIDSHPYVTFFLLICVLLAAGVLGYLASTSGARGQGADSPNILPPRGTFIGKQTPYDRHLIELDKVALDAAYVDQLQRLFSVWMKDDSNQPDRAIKGAQQARRAFILVMEQIEKRERDLPPP
jgi:hypothetical protein